LIPELYLHGLASGDSELALALRELWGEEAPLSGSSLATAAQAAVAGEYEQWKSAAVEVKEWAYFRADEFM
jgi:hypothetical protein